MYFTDVYVCSEEPGLTPDSEELKACCDPRVALTRRAAKILVEVSDVNINAPNFDFYVGEDQAQNVPEGTVSENDGPKKVLTANSRDSDFTLPNTQTCYQIITHSGIFI